MRINERFRLQRGQARRLRMSFDPASNGIVEIFLDENVVVTVRTAQVREAPLTVPTTAGELRVHLKPALAATNWDLTLDGVPVPGAQNDPIAKIQLGAGAAMFLGTCWMVSAGAALAGDKVSAETPYVLGLGALIFVGGVGAWKHSLLAAWGATLLALPTFIMGVLSVFRDKSSVPETLFIPGLVAVYVVHSAVRGVTDLKKRRQQAAAP